MLRLLTCLTEEGNVSTKMTISVCGLLLLRNAIILRLIASDIKGFGKQSQISEICIILKLWKPQIKIFVPFFN